MVILLIITTFQLLSIDTTDIFKNILFTTSMISENVKVSFAVSYEKLAILNVSQQWTSTGFS